MNTMAHSGRLALLLSFAAVTSCFHSPHLAVWQPALRRTAPASIPRANGRVAGLWLKMSATEKINVAVIGGGPAGLAAASNLLDVESVGSVTIIERAGADSFSDGPGTWGIGCGPRAQALLGNITGDPWHSYIKDKGLFNPRILNYRANRPIIREGIYKSLVSHPRASGLNLEFGTTVSNFNLKEKKLELDNGKNVDYDCLVVADGSHSSTLASIDMPQFATERRAFWSCVKIMPGVEIPNDTQTYMFKKDKNTIWLMSWKDARRYILIFFGIDPKTGKNPAGMSTLQELRAYFDELEPAGSLSLPTSAGQPPKLNVSDYFYKLDDKTLEDFLEREPRPMWCSRTKAIVDEESGIVLVGDSAGTNLPTLGAGTCMAIQDADNLKKSFLVAEAKEGGVRAALVHYKSNGAKERKAMVALNLLCMAIRQKWGTRLPVLRKLDNWVTEQVEEPNVSLARLYRSPLVWPLAKIAVFMWFRFWGLKEDFVRDWRSGVESAKGVKDGEEEGGERGRKLQSSGAV